MSEMFNARGVSDENVRGMTLESVQCSFLCEGSGNGDACLT